MAYLIVNSQNQLYKIASNDTEKNNQNCTIPPYSTIEISDADFLKIKQNLVNINISGETASFTDIDFTDFSFSETHLTEYHKDVIQSLTSFMDVNKDHSFWNEANDYRGFLQSFDYASLSLPLSITWEKYCQDKSISSIHPLQIP